MEIVKIKKIELSNFKGIAELKIDFNEDVTRIYAPNGSGKSTIKNAWEWCLCQNIEGVMPSLNNKEIRGLEPCVTITLDVNDNEYILCRKIKTKYMVDKDTGVEKKSNTNIYMVDGIEMPQATYQSQVASIIGNSTFNNLPLLTDKEYFNTDTINWKWNNRRKLLLQMCNVDNAVSDLIEKDEYKDISSYLRKGYATSDIATSLKRELNEAKDKQKRNMVLISQKNVEIDEYLGIDFAEIGQKLSVAKTKLTKLLNNTNEENKSEKLLELQEKLSEYTKEYTKLSTQNEIEHGNLKTKQLAVYREAGECKTQYTQLKYDKEHADIALASLKNKSVETVCPTCNQNLPVEKIESAKAEINKLITEKEQDIERIINTMKLLKEKYDVKQAEYNELVAQEKNKEENPRIIELKTLISDTQDMIKNEKSQVLKKLSQDERYSLENEIESLERQMAKKEFIEKGEKLIKQWKTENLDVADEIIKIENKQRALQSFIREQTDIISGVVNSHFCDGITWSLYEVKYNGSVNECCDLLYNGKRYETLSTGEKNIVNLHLVKILQDYFEVNAPVMSDNAESISSEIVTDRQLIELYATIPVDKKEKDYVKLQAVKITDLYK